jgi:hypothetical protein
MRTPDAGRSPPLPESDGSVPQGQRLMPKPFKTDPADQPNVDLIASKLHWLDHPDGTPVRFMGFAPAGKPKAVRDAGSSAATRAAQAIIYTLKSAGKSIVDTTSIPKTVKPIDNSKPRVIEVWCGLCDAPKPLFSLTLRNPDTNNRVNVPGPQLLEGLRTIATACPHITAPPIDNVADVAKAHNVTVR